MTPEPSDGVSRGGTGSHELPVVAANCRPTPGVGDLPSLPMGSVGQRRARSRRRMNRLTTATQAGRTRMNQSTNETATSRTKPSR